ncbi:SURF1 family protein [Cutibacterium sp. WCA-380-WT-3A]|uniref:SURF1-like protein n=1 Tax=Cutibacterium porci TaxID=2605781 RepID=A0A7K0J4A4_9ACTN|nr:SURF1 family protein [Cutibacterium porci]MSS44668.1 SURF1 family protein [Cutibacterium porci]
MADAVRTDGSHSSVKQVFIILLGIALAGVMVFLGLWQMHVFQAQQDGSTQARINEPVITWAEAPEKADVMAQYGRRITITGTFQPSTTTLVGTSWPVRVATGVKLTSGETVAVVRGQLSKGQRIPTPPRGTVTMTGVLAASESDDDHRDTQMPVAVLPSLRLEVLTQTWPQPLVPATLTLDDKNARAQGLTPAQPVLPKGDGGERNRGYALQWWVFAIFTVAMSIAFARAVGKSKA